MNNRILRSDVGIPHHLWLLVAVLVTVELVLSASDALSLSLDLRRLALIYGAFWLPVLNGTIVPIFEGQAVSMFVTHAFVHGGLVHVAFNSVMLLAFGKLVATHVGPWKTLLVLVVSAILGAAAFAVLAVSLAPMVGASGAVFGLLGAWMFWDARTRYHLRLSMNPILSALGGLILANILLALVLEGNLAWQAHLGGFMAGVLVASIMKRR